MQRTLERLRSEFLEMPGLRLTAEQAHRLCGVERATCARALEALVEEKFLCAKENGTYGRLTDGHVPRPRPAKAGLDPLTASSDPLGDAKRRSSSR